jgi:hypothetical protein
VAGRCAGGKLRSRPQRGRAGPKPWLAECRVQQRNAARPRGAKSGLLFSRFKLLSLPKLGYSITSQSWLACAAALAFFGLQHPLRSPRAHSTRFARLRRRLGFLRPSAPASLAPRTQLSPAPQPAARAHSSRPHASAYVGPPRLALSGARAFAFHRASSRSSLRITPRAFAFHRGRPSLLAALPRLASSSNSLRSAR